MHKNDFFKSNSTLLNNRFKINYITIFSFSLTLDTNQTLKKALNLWKGSTLSQKLKNKKNIEATQFYENSLVK